MRLVRQILTSFMLLSLLGCTAMNPRYLAQPVAIRTTGPYIHSASGMTFSSAVGNFQRTLIYRYDEDGLDVSVGYNWFEQARAIAATVYVYPAPPLVSIMAPEEVVATARANLSLREFEFRKQKILQSQSGAKLIEEKEVTLSQTGITYVGRMATFEFEDTFFGLRQSLQSHLLFFCYVSGKWIIKYRFTHPKDFDASRHMDQFMADLPWTLKDS